MSHDRGCFCGRERYEYQSCPDPACHKKDSGPVNVVQLPRGYNKKLVRTMWAVRRGKTWLRWTSGFSYGKGRHKAYTNKFEHARLFPDRKIAEKYLRKGRWPDQLIRVMVVAHD